MYKTATKSIADFVHFLWDPIDLKAFYSNSVQQVKIIQSYPLPSFFSSIMFPTIK